MHEEHPGMKIVHDDGWHGGVLGVHNAVFVTGTRVVTRNSEPGRDSMGFPPPPPTTPCFASGFFLRAAGVANPNGFTGFQHSQKSRIKMKLRIKKRIRSWIKSTSPYLLSWSIRSFGGLSGTVSGNVPEKVMGVGVIRRIQRNGVFLQGRQQLRYGRDGEEFRHDLQWFPAA